MNKFSVALLAGCAALRNARTDPDAVFNVALGYTSTSVLDPVSGLATYLLHVHIPHDRGLVAYFERPETWHRLVNRAIVLALCGLYEREHDAMDCAVRRRPKSWRSWRQFGLVRPTLQLLDHGLRDRPHCVPSDVRANGLVELLKILPRTVVYACKIGDNNVGTAAFGAAVRVWTHCNAVCGRLCVEPVHERPAYFAQDCPIGLSADAPDDFGRYVLAQEPQSAGPR